MNIESKFSKENFTIFCSDNDLFWIKHNPTESTITIIPDEYHSGKYALELELKLNTLEQKVIQISDVSLEDAIKFSKIILNSNISYIGNKENEEEDDIYEDFNNIDFIDIVKPVGVLH